ncbi:unnamed protein product [[Candida] boidinii]|nr:unnamed protein product [[Candida] boidinii]
MAIGLGFIAMGTRCGFDIDDNDEELALFIDMLVIEEDLESFVFDLDIPVGFCLGTEADGDDISFCESGILCIGKSRHSRGYI